MWFGRWSFQVAFKCQKGTGIWGSLFAIMSRCGQCILLDVILFSRLLPACGDPSCSSSQIFFCKYAHTVEHHLTWAYLAGEPHQLLQYPAIWRIGCEGWVLQTIGQDGPAAWVWYVSILQALHWLVYMHWNQVGIHPLVGFHMGKLGCIPLPGEGFYCISAQVRQWSHREHHQYGAGHTADERARTYGSKRCIFGVGRSMGQLGENWRVVGWWALARNEISILVHLGTLLKMKHIEALNNMFLLAKLSHASCFRGGSMPISCVGSGNGWRYHSCFVVLPMTQELVMFCCTVTVMLKTYFETSDVWDLCLLFCLCVCGLGFFGASMWWCVYTQSAQNRDLLDRKSSKHDGPMVPW